MLKFVVLFLLAALTLAQGPPNEQEHVIDDIHGYRVEYDDRNNIILFVSNSECYIIEAPDRTWDQIVRNKEELYLVTDEIYAQILTGLSITSLTQAEATQEYDSNLEQWQCHGKHIYKVRFTPQI